MSYILRTDKTWAENIRELRLQLERWGVKDWQVEPIPDGTRVDPAVARRVILHFTLRGAEIVFTQEKQDRRVDNLRVITLIVESLRLNEVRGIGDAMREAYLALPPPSGKPLTDTDDPYAMLAANRDMALEDIERLYKLKAQRLHPDQGGDAGEMARLNGAIARIRKERAKA